MPLIASSESRIIKRRAATTQRWLVSGIGAANCIAAYEPMDAATQAASYSNLNNPGIYDCMLGVAPTWAAGTGWGLNGTTQWLNTGINPDANTSVIVRFSGGIVKVGVYQAIAACSTADATKRILLMPVYDNSGGGRRLYAHSSGLVFAGAATSGVIAICGAKAFLNGTQETGTMTGGASVGFSMYIGARNNAGTADWFMQCEIQRMYIYNIDVSAYISALTTSINS